MSADYDDDDDAACNCDDCGDCDADCALRLLDQGLRVAGVAAGDCGGLLLFCVWGAV